MQWGNQPSKWLVVGLVGVSWFSDPRPLFACNCVPLKLPSEALQEADAVFLGTVERFEPSATVTTETTNGDVPRIATVRVKSVWKGIEGSRVKITTASSGPVCGYDFVVGYDYLIYAYRSKEGMLTTSLCTRTRPEHEARLEDLPVLGVGAVPMNPVAVAIYPYLVSDRHAYFPSQDVNLSCSLIVPKGHTVRIQDSFLLIRDHTERTVFSKQEACGQTVDEETLSFRSSVEHGQVPHFEPGVYQATWEINGVRSNTVSFEVVAGPICEEPPLTIEWLGRRYGMAREPHLLVRLANTGQTPLQLPDVLATSILRIDGQPSKLTILAWAGFSTLPPGEAWGALLSFDDYEPRITPGSHQVQLDFVGHQSNVLTVDWKD